mmetsp:Transcript_75778/g.202885  ORF Transcript_75778/g.202885 Transcript_75778/m.202885 type:complete len:219 (+) Transcript_75778:951-1607(+)
MYNEAIALKTYVRNNISTNQKSSVEVNLVREYLSRLEEWVQTIRFPSKCPVKRDQFEDLIQEISADISQIPSKSSCSLGNNSTRESLETSVSPSTLDAKAHPDSSSKLPNSPATKSFTLQCKSASDCTREHQNTVARLASHQSVTDIVMSVSFEFNPSPDCQSCKGFLQPELVEEDQTSCERFIRSCFEDDPGCQLDARVSIKNEYDFVRRAPSQFRI